MNIPGLEKYSIRYISVDFLKNRHVNGLTFQDFYDNSEQGFL